MRKHKNGFDDNETVVSQSLERKKALNVSTQQNKLSLQPSTMKEYVEFKRMLQRELRTMKNECRSKVFSEIPSAFDKKDLKFCNGFMRKVFGSLTSSIAPLRSKDNTTIIKEPEKSSNNGNRTSPIYLNISNYLNILESLSQFETKFEMDRLPT